MAVEEKSDLEVNFSEFAKIRRMVDGDTVVYFRKWVEMIGMEQTANNVNIMSQQNALSLMDKGAVKDMNLRVIEIERKNSGVIVHLERLYYAYQKEQIMNGSNEIKIESHVNLLTIN